MKQFILAVVFLALVYLSLEACYQCSSNNEPAPIDTTENVIEADTVSLDSIC